MRSLAIALLVSLAALTAFAQTDQDIADRIQEKYESITSFTATFEQTQTRAAIGISTDFKGVIHFKQPALIRWETVEPEEAHEIIVVGEEKVWDYVVDMNTVNIMGRAQLLSSKTLMRFISGRANLKEDFRVEDVWDGDERLKEDHWKDSGLLLFRLVPFEPEAGMMLAYIGVDPDSMMLTRVMTVDYQGNANEMRLTSIDTEAKIKDSLFTFEMPEGVDVNDMTVTGQ